MSRIRLKCRTTHVNLTFGSCATFVTNPSNIHGAAEGIWRKLRALTLTCERCMTHRPFMNICAKYERHPSNRHGARSKHDTNLERPVLHTPFTWKCCATHRHLKGCICTIYKVNTPNKHEATARIRPWRVSLTYGLITWKRTVTNILWDWCLV